MTASASPLSASSFAQMTLSLLLVVGLIIAISWLLKRMRIAAPRGRGDMSILAELAVGPRERIVLVRVGEAQVLVGVGTSGVVGLMPLSAPIALATPTSTPAFADRLREYMKRAGDAP